MMKLRDYAEDWLEDYFKQNNITKAVFEARGKRNDIVLNAMLSDVLGDENVYGITFEEDEQKRLNVKKKCGLANMYWIPFSHAERAAASALKQLRPLESAEERNDSLYSARKKLAKEFAARQKMSLLYLAAGELGAAVVSTASMSESYIGKTVLWGELACDCAPFRCFTGQDIAELGRQLGLPEELLKEDPFDLEAEEGITWKQVDQIVKLDRPLDNEGKYDVVVDKKVLQMAKERGKKLLWMKVPNPGAWLPQDKADLLLSLSEKETEEFGKSLWGRLKAGVKSMFNSLEIDAEDDDEE